MFKSFSDFLQALKEREQKEIESQGIRHAPTIGNMYEGLSKKVIGLAIPHELNLQLER